MTDPIGAMCDGHKGWLDVAGRPPARGLSRTGERTVSRALAICLMVGLVGLVGTAGARNNHLDDVQEVFALLDAWRLTDAENALSRLSRRRGADAGLRVARAAVFYHQGKYEAAQKLLLRTKMEVDHKAYTYFSRLSERVKKATRIAKQAQRLRSAAGHFEISAPTGPDEVLLYFAAETLEEIRGRIGRVLGYFPADTIRVEIYARAQDLADVSELTLREIKSSGTVALSHDNRLMLLTPRRFAGGYAWRTTLAHEYIHFVVSRLSHNLVPVWIQEGLAKVLEPRWRETSTPLPELTAVQEYLLASALRKRRLIPWERMHPSLAKLKSQREVTLAFAQAQTALAFIVERAGEPGLASLVRELSRGHGVWVALKRVTKLSKRRFHREWLRYLKKLKMKPQRGLALAERRIGFPRSKEARILAFKERKAQLHFRVGELLKKRGKHRAAAIEYRKSLALVGATDAFVANTLARTYLASKQVEAARKVLGPVLRCHPDDASIRTTMGEVSLLAGDQPGARRHFEAALAINPFRADIHCHLAQLLEVEDLAQPQHQRFCVLP